MEETYISFETAKLAKEKGFKEKVNYSFVDLSSFDSGIDRAQYMHSQNHNEKGHRYSCPSQSLLQKWLREEHEIIVFAQHETIDDAESAWTWAIKIYVQEGVEGTRKKKEYDFWKCHYSLSYENMMWWKTYEEALEDGLLKALKLIK